MLKRMFIRKPEVDRICLAYIFRSTLILAFSCYSVVPCILPVCIKLLEKKKTLVPLTYTSSIIHLHTQHVTSLTRPSRFLVCNVEWAWELQVGYAV